MTSRVYGSMEAFITHWRALRGNDGAPALNGAEGELLRAMDAVLEGLEPAERAALEPAGDSASADRASAAANALARRRQRSLTKLTPILTTAGWLQ